MIVGDAGAVRALEAELVERTPERARVTVDVWVREEAGLPGARHKLTKKAMVILYGAGDIERSRVCTSCARR